MTVRVLIADDDPVTRIMLEAAARSVGLDPLTVVDGAQALAALTGDDPPAMAVLDWVMPRRTGPEVVMELRRIPRDRYTYTILVTSRADSGDIAAGLDAGADDYVLKSAELVELCARLRTGRRLVELQRELIATREALRIQATRDALTGLLNRREIMRRLLLEAERAGRQGTGLSVLLIDLDHFKQVNDTYGHPAGDAVLRASASRMQSALRAYDLLGRYGGEEFLAVLPECSLADAEATGDRLRVALSQTPVVCAAGTSIMVTCSIGLAAMASDDPRALINRADRALYRAKREGRDQVVTCRAPRAGAHA